VKGSCRDDRSFPDLDQWFRSSARPAPVSTARRWLGLFAVLAATTMNLVDATVVNVAAPAIRADLGGSYTSLQWIARPRRCRTDRG
jgi:hypothetical protein